MRFAFYKSDKEDWTIALTAMKTAAEKWLESLDEPLSVDRVRILDFKAKIEGELQNLRRP